MRICVTGGAGYIGSVVSMWLVQAGHEVTILDNLSTGHRQAISPDCRFVEGDIRDEQALASAVTGQTDAVFHFAARSLVGESVGIPLAYYDNNVTGSVALLHAMRDAGVRRMVFSSSAAVYGVPDELPIPETAPCRPTNPYGSTKWMIERVLSDCGNAWGLSWVALRYFNAGGSSGALGEDHDPETHLIPVVVDAAMGRRDNLTIFGDDYETSDGTCVRDYIHVVDLADAHGRALDAMEGGFSGVVNLGSETPFTVREVVETTRTVTGLEVPHTVGPRRPGDPPALLASSSRAATVLGWTPHHSTLDEIIRSAWQWRRTRPGGYAG